MATTESLPRSDNRDGQFINFHEEFRHAKRNSLAWSAVLLIAAIAQAAPDARGGMRVPGTDLTVSQPVLLALLVPTAIYFFASYRRALKIVSISNTQAAQHATEVWGSIANVIEGIRERIREPQQLADTMQDKQSAIDTIVSRFRSALSVLPQDFSYSTEAKSNYHFAVDNVRRTLEAEPRADVVIKPGERPWERSWEKTQSAFDRLLERSEERIDEITRYRDAAVDAAEEAAKDLVEITGERDTAIASLQESLGTLEKSLTGFRTGIIDSERRSHLFLDRVAVIGLFVIAMIAMLVRSALMIIAAYFEISI